MGEELYSDFYEGSITSRDMTAAYFESILKTMKASGLTIAVKGCNSYVLNYADYAFEIPYSSDMNPLLDTSVPFVQIVLSGSVSYTMPPINYEPDIGRYLLKAVETGSGLYFDCFASPNDYIKDTNYNRFYNCEFGKISSTLAEAVKFIDGALKPVCGSRISGHYKLMENVYVTEYENGKKIVVNYNGEQAATVFGNVPASGYAVSG